MPALDPYTMGRVGAKMDQGTDSDGWDISILESLWELVKAAGLVAECEWCGQEFCTASNDGECPFEFCDGPPEPDEEDELDDELAEAGVL